MNGKKRGSSADVMRFVFIGLAVVLVIFLAFIMINVYRSSVREDVNIVIMDESESEEMTENILENKLEEESESELLESESDTKEELIESESETESESESVKADEEKEEQTESETESESETQKESESERQRTSPAAGRSTTVAGANTDSSSSDEPDNESVQGQADEEENIVIVSDDESAEVYDEGNDEYVDEEAQPWYEPTGNYVSLSSTCYFRSEPGYEDANGNDTIMWELPGGTVVEVLYDNGGWAEVQVDGVVGYVGSKFLAY